MNRRIAMILMMVFMVLTMTSLAFANEAARTSDFPKSDSYYGEIAEEGFFDIVVARVQMEPFNAIGTLIFFIAIAHTLLTSYFIKASHFLDERYEKLIADGKRDKNSRSIPASILHLLGEVEVVFGFWAVFLALAITFYYDWGTFVTYVENLHYSEPLFVIVIMTVASSRPILKLYDLILWRIVRVFGDSLEVWWLTILIVSGILGAFITGTAAMAMAALILGEKFYNLNPSRRLRYITLALLFVNISVGGALTHFASPPIMMVAAPWSWDMTFMLVNFGWKAVLAIFIATFAYYFIARKELSELKVAYEDYKFKKYIQHRFISEKELEENFTELEKLVDRKVHFTSEIDAYSIILKENIKELAKQKLTPEECEKYDISNAIDEKFDDIVSEELQKSIPGLRPLKDRQRILDASWDAREDRVPGWIMLVHVFFLIWTVVNAEVPVLFLAGFLFFLGFYQVTEFYQNRLDLKTALMVAFFLSGILIHGTLQSWWISPLLSSLQPLPLTIVATLLTAFNDNAAITYLSSLVPNFPDSLKYAVVSGALAGGGLTVIANSPNPVGLSVLKKYFKSGISAGMLLKYALLPTVISLIMFILL